MADFEYFRVLSVFSWKKSARAQKSVLNMASSNSQIDKPQHGHPKRAELRCKYKHRRTLYISHGPMLSWNWRVSQHASVAWHHSLVFCLQKVSGYPLYHTLHETVTWLEKFVDPTYEYHKAMAQVSLQLLLEITEPAIIPFNLDRYSQALCGYGKILNDSYGRNLMSQNITLGEGILEHLSIWFFECFVGKH